MFLVLSMRDGRFPTKPEPSDKLRCPECSCKNDTGKRADCLIRRYREAYDRIEANSIATWYYGLSGQAAKDVRAFFRTAAPSDPQIRQAFDRILTRELRQQEGLRVKVEMEKGSGRPSVALRDAFMLTAMVAAHEWTGIELLDEANRTRMNKDCAARVGREFGLDATRVRNQWRRFRTRAAVSEKLATDRHQGWRWREYRRIGTEVLENCPFRAAALERIKSHSRVSGGRRYVNPPSFCCNPP